MLGVLAVWSPSWPGRQSEGAEPADRDGAERDGWSLLRTGAAIRRRYGFSSIEELFSLIGGVTGRSDTDSHAECLVVRLRDLVAGRSPSRHGRRDRNQRSRIGERTGTPSLQAPMVKTGSATPAMFWSNADQ
ncbi:MAG: hypothetical protein KatS3mg008_1716 [Acidimicrobiales bacterium]|nr:MAG: hypothetical protein KatS3mg008_1716 [Acidimicrobiales bacterium]